MKLYTIYSKNGGYGWIYAESLVLNSKTGAYDIMVGGVKISSIDNIDPLKVPIVLSGAVIK